MLLNGKEYTQPITCAQCGGNTSYHKKTDQHVCIQCGLTIENHSQYAYLIQNSNNAWQLIPKPEYGLIDLMPVTERLFDTLPGVKQIILIDQAIEGSNYYWLHM
jgi:ribosomal protein L37E